MENVDTLGTRDDFIDRYSTSYYGLILRQFNDILFGIVCTYRNQLLGEKEAMSGEYNTGTGEMFSNGLQSSAMNFRTLLLSCFKPHGGKGGGGFITDQHVVYVEISRESAADALAVRRFLNLIQEYVKTGAPGRPRYVVVGGDQPSYKYFVEMWMESWRKKRSPRGKRKRSCYFIIGLSLSQGFFHAEK